MMFVSRLMLAMLLVTGTFAHAHPAAAGGSVAGRLAARTYLRDHARDPYEYVAEQFRDHDLVLVGEWHLGRQNLEFLKRLIPQLPQAGVFTLGYEFASSED